MAGIEDYFIEFTDGSPRLAVHLFRDILTEVLRGNKTAAEGKQALADYVGEALSAEAVSDATAIMDYVAAGSNYVGKRQRIDYIYSIISLGQHGVWYGTKSELRARLIQEIT